MITYIVGDLFESPAQVLVNTVNTVGVMGKGIALDFKRFYPEMFEHYQQLCEQKLFDIGQLWLYKTPHKWILNFPTKKHWRQKSKPEYIEAGLQKFVATYREKGITSISFPQLGCGNGELDWETQVRPLMEHYLKNLKITIYIHLYEKDGLIPEHRDKEAIRSWLHGEPQALSFMEFWEDVAEVIRKRNNFVTLDTQTNFFVEIIEDGLNFHIANEKIYIPKDEEGGFLDLWQYIRKVGYVIGDSFPFGLDTYAPYIISLLSEIRYLRSLRLSRMETQQHQIGLQLVPTSPDNPQVLPQFEYNVQI